MNVQGELLFCGSLGPLCEGGFFVMPFNSLYNFCWLATKAKNTFFSLDIYAMIN